MDNGGAKLDDGSARAGGLIASSEVADVERDAASSSDGNVVEFGIGLHRKSSLRVSSGANAGRRRSVNLRGTSKADGEVKRRSASFGKSLSSLDEDGLPPPEAAAADSSWGDAFGAISEDLFRTDDLDADAEGLGGFDMGDVADAVASAGTPDGFGEFGDEEPAEEQPQPKGFSRKTSVYGGFG
jgi:hypothetical protein